MVFFIAVVAHFAVAALALIGLRRRPVIAAGIGLVVLAGTALAITAEGIGATSAPRKTIVVAAFGFQLHISG